MSAQAVVVVRRANTSDVTERVQLLAAAHKDSLTDAFFYFFFQEMTLQGVVLIGAVLFIFCGVSVPLCALVLPAAAALVLASLHVQHSVYTSNLSRALRTEVSGWVAEYRGPLTPPSNTYLVREDEASSGPCHRRVVGSVSVWPHRWAPGAAWLAGLAVGASWRHKGIASALLAAVRQHAATEGLMALHSATSHLQPAARSLLHKHGWECRNTYHRPLLGDALTLPMAHLVLDLPHA